MLLQREKAFRIIEAEMININLFNDKFPNYIAIRE